MPTYEFQCENCDVVEVFHGMNEKHPKACPQCGSKDFELVFNTHVSFIKPADSNWENENNGLGRWLPQAGPRYLDAKTKKKPNLKAYARSQNAAIERFKERGYTDITKD